MARIFIFNDAQTVRIEVRAVEEPDSIVIDGEVMEVGAAVGRCPRCGEWLTDRGHFEDTCSEIANHLDRKH